MDDDKKSAIATFLANPQVQAVIRAAFASSGFVYVYLTNHGATPDQVNVIHDLLIQWGPAAISLGWSLIEKTHAKIIAMAANILAKRQEDGQPAGTIIINQSASNGAAKAVADPTLKNVVPAGSPEALKAAVPAS